MAFVTILTQVSVLFLLMGLGFSLSKFGVVDSKGSGQMTFILCYIVSPAIIIYAFQIKFEQDKFFNLLISAGAAVFIHIFNITAGTVIFNKKTVKSKYKRAVARYACTYSNSGFMGFPLLQAIAPNIGLFYGSAYSAVFNLFSWTHGILLYSGKKSVKSVAKVVLNPNVIAVIAGSLLFYFSVKLPSPIYLSVKYLSQLNTPLSMIVIGTTLTEVPFKGILRDKLALAICLARNILLPLPVLFILHAAGLHGTLLLCCIIQASCPAAGNTVLYAKLTGNDIAFPGKVMALSTVFSLLSLPFMISAVSYLHF